MKVGYMILLFTTTAFALVYGLLNQLAGNLGWAFGYICLSLFGSTLLYLVGWKFSREVDEDEERRKALPFQ
jgi:membrane protein implicated in regulation of membrane protease activity